MESLDQRLKRIEQRLSSIEKFVAESYTKNKGGSALSKVTEAVEDGQKPVETAKDYHYNYAESNDFANQPKATFHFVDTSIFKEQKVITVTDDTFTVLLFGAFIIFLIYFGARFIVDGNWLAPASQTSLAALVGITFIGLGFVLTNTMEKYAKYFPIVGIIVLYVAAFAAGNFYGIIPKNAALGFVFLISAMSLFLSRKFELEVYQVIAVLGAYLSPLYIAFHGGGFVNYYYLSISLFFMFMSVYYEMNALPILGAFLALGVCTISEYIDNDVMNLVLYTLAHFIFYASAYALKAVRSPAGVSKLYTYSFFPFALLFYLIEYYYISSFKTMWTPAFTAFTSVLLALFYLGVRHFSKDEKNELTGTLLLTLASLTAIHTLFYVIVPDKFRPISLVVAAFISIKLLEKLQDEKWRLYSIMMTFSLTGLIGLNYFEVIFSQFNAHTKLPIVNGFIYAAVFGYITFLETKLAEVKVNPLFTAGAAHFIVLSSIYNLTRNSGTAICVLASGIYFLAAVASLFLLNKKNEANN